MPIDISELINLPTKKDPCGRFAAGVFLLQSIFINFPHFKAGHVLAGEDFFHFGVSSAASVVAVGAAIHKAAAGLHVDGARHVAFQFDLHALALLVGIGDGDGRKEGFRVGVQRIAVEVFRGADFHELAQIHNRDAVGNVAHHGKVVGDKEQGEAQFLLHVFQKVHDLRLNGDVQGGDGLVADDEFGF